MPFDRCCGAIGTEAASLMSADALEEIRRLYFKATRATIDHDFDRDVDLLKAMPESERPRATVFMQGLAEMRKEFKKTRRKG